MIDMGNPQLLCRMIFAFTQWRWPEDLSKALQIPPSMLSCPQGMKFSPGKPKPLAKLMTSTDNRRAASFFCGKMQPRQRLHFPFRRRPDGKTDKEE